MPPPPLPPLQLLFSLLPLQLLLLSGSLQWCLIRHLGEYTWPVTEGLQTGLHAYGLRHREWGWQGSRKGAHLAGQDGWWCY